MKRGTSGIGVAATLALAMGIGPATPATAQEKKAESAPVKNRETTPRYTRVDTKAYTVEVPEGWKVSEETSFGQREIMPIGRLERAGGMSTMTGAGLGRQSWDQLYQTSLYFINRYDGKKMTATPYRLLRTKQGFEACAWTMLDSDKSPRARYVILKSAGGNILALSVKMPDRDTRARMEEHFERMVASAVVK